MCGGISGSAAKLCVVPIVTLYGEMVMREVEDMEGLKVGSHSINNVRYADDTMQFADSKEK